MKQKNIEIYNRLDAMHPDAECELNYGDPFQLLVAVILSAQCTDKRVNEVTKELFKVVKTPEDMVNIKREELEKLIFTCGFYHNKAKSLQGMAASVVKKGYVPDNMEELLELDGVGRKTANVIMAEAYKKPAIAVDTHVFRVSNRIGLVNTDTPEKTEFALKKEFDEDKWSHLHHLLIFHGRYMCKSQNPNCKECKLQDMCKYYGEKR